ncbi:ornithine cyclodeaminase [uncultured Devosia sp.]|uniref:ornithine cyclodeaminase n=1 Tax=uncultured Devosia sp. TaxID=211434 RepID=UPI00262AF8C0|nr:ornithine cyclodeaminase [uncultured Devosia sp.]
MTQFVGVNDLSKMVGTMGPRRFLRRLVEYLADDFARWGQFEKVPRIASHSPIGVIELMPTSDGALYSFKYVNGHPGNPKQGKLTVTAFGVLSDVATGYPLLISEMTLLTALRTAATSAYAAKLLARPESRVMALIGAGAQSEFQTLAFQEVLGIKEVVVFDPDPAVVKKYMRNAAGFGLTLRAASSVEPAVAGADMVTVCTAVKGRQALVSRDMLKPGVHINAIGGDCPGKTELDRNILDDAQVFVEFTPQTRIEGEIQQMGAEFGVTELWEVETGRKAGRTDTNAVTVFDSVGFAVEDFSALRLVHDLMEGRGKRLDLVPDLGNPKDLYGALLGGVEMGMRVA